MENNKYELTYPQKNIWLVEKLNENTAINAITGIINIKENFDANICNLVINQVIKENDALRIRIKNNIGKVSQNVSDYMVEDFEIVDMSSKIKSNIDVYLDEYARQSLSTKNENLYEFKILKYSHNQGAILMKIHHIISDAWSCSLIGTKLISLYDNYIEKQKSDEKLPPSYIDYIKSEQEYINSEKMIQDEKFWKEYLSGAKSNVGLKSNSLSSNVLAKRYTADLEEEFNAKLLTFCKDNKISVYALFIAILSVYIYRIKDERDFLIGTPILNRANFKEKQIIGMFVSTILVRIKIDEQIKVLELAKNISIDNLKLFRHQKYPYSKIEQIMKNDRNNGQKLYNIMVSYQNARTKLDNTKYSTDWKFSGCIQDEIDIHIMDMDDTGILKINYDYLTDVFSEKEIRYLHTRLIAILSNLINNPDINVEEIDIMSKEEKDKILFEFNNTKTDYPRDKTVIELFEEQVEKTPNSIAIVFEDEKITYKNLNEMSNKLANYLREEKKIGVNDIVGIMMDKSSRLIVTILACLKLQACYIPIDNSYPKDRKIYMIENSGCKIVITDENGDTLASDKEILNLKYNEINNYSNCNLQINDSLYNDNVYIMYTSGTTGNPKGVIVENKNIVRLVKNTNYIEFLPTDKIIQTGSIVFDASTFEYWGALLNGLPLYLIKKQELLEPSRLKQYVSDNGITIMWLTSALFNQMIGADIEIFENIRVLLVGGDILSPKHINKVKEKYSNIKVINGYGPTENTTFSCCYEINDTFEDNIPIGKPIANSKCYIVDKKQRLLPIFVEGELLVSGDGVAKGYLNNEELTNKKFIADPFNTDNIAYKTGDIAYFLDDGNVSFVGRTDNQVKIRGVRIELDELKNAILQIDGIDDCVVLADKAKNSLTVFYTSTKTISNDTIYNYLHEKLPMYYLPNRLVNIPYIPLNNNGKVDMKRLNEFCKVKRNNSFNNDNTKLQSEIIDIICNISGSNLNDISKNIYEFGIDSLSAIKLSLKLNEKYHTNLSPKNIFELNTIDMIASYIQNNSSSINLKLGAKQDKYPLTVSQSGIFSEYSIEPNSSRYNIVFEVRFSKKLDLEKLKSSIKEAVLSQDTLFTKFKIEDGQVYQFVDNVDNFDISVENVDEKEYIERKDKNIKVFDLLQDRLFCIKMYVTESNIYVIFNFHHIIFDGTSIYILLNTIKENYCGQVKKFKSDICLGQVAIFEQEQKKSNKYNQAREYFLNMFDGELPNNELPLDIPRKINKTFNGNNMQFKLDKNIVNKLKEFAINNGVTLNSVLFAMFNFLLAKYMYNEDIIVGIAKDDRCLKEEENIIGMFVKTIPFRTKIDYHKTIIDFVKEVHISQIEMFDNAVYPYEELINELDIKRNTNQNPLFDIMFVYQNFGMPEILIDNTDIKINTLTNNTSKFDLTCEIMPNGNEIDINLEYNCDLLYEDTIRNFGIHYINILNYMLDNTTARLYDIDMLSQTEKDVILNTFNATKVDYPKDSSLVEIFEEFAKNQPDKVAVVFEDKKITYDELNKKANKLARYLLSKNIQCGDFVSVMIDKSIEYMISIIAILKCRAAYISLTKELPDERMKYMIENAGSKLILTTKEYYRNVTDIEIVDITKEEIFNSDKFLDENLEITYNAKDIVHIIYTSGTTGNPKGNMIINRGIVRLVKNTNYLEYTSDDVMLSTSTLTFDTSTFEIWGAILNGMTLHLLGKEKVLEPRYYSKYLAQNKITTTLIPTPIFNQLVEVDVNMFSNMRAIYVGGDVMLSKYANKVYENCKNVKLYNVYGPAENTVICTANLIDKKYEGSIPIGAVVSNNVCYVVDKCEKLCPVKVRGDLFVGGDGLGLGYINMEEMTKDKFVNVDFTDEKLYKTGDLTYWDTDGKLNYLSRIDMQLKIRGQRIEVLEIQNRLLELDNISEAVITVHEKNDKKYLIAYYTTNSEITEIDIKLYLQKYLPKYMIPYKFVKLEKMPLNQNGKIDKKALPKVKVVDSVNIVLPKNKEQEKLLNIFKNVLSNDDIGINSDFFECGGDSLLVVSLASKLMSSGYDIRYADVYKYSTVEEIYNLLYKNESKSSISKGIENYNYRDIEKIMACNDVKNIDEIKIKENLGNVLLTGVTGFLGVHVLESLINNGVEKVYCLIREKDGKGIETRIKEKLNFFFDKKTSEHIYSKIKLINGDLTLTGVFSDSKGAITEMINDISLVINCAASVKHFGSVSRFMDINVKGVQNLTEFCVKYKKELIQISTLSVSGNILEGGQIIQKNIVQGQEFSETNLYIGQDLDNIYAYTKFLGEKVVYEAMINSGLKAKVIRMGNLTGRYRDGKFQPNVEENAFSNRIKTLVDMKIIPQSIYDLYIEMTPIDYAAEAIVKLAFLDGEFNTFHLFNDNHVIMPKLLQVLKEYGVDINILSDEEVKNVINEFKKNDDLKKIEGILNDIGIDGSIKYNDNIKVKSDFTKDILKKFGFIWPNAENEYLRLYINYLIDIKFIEI